MANNLSVKDAAGTTRQIHTIEDSTSVHYNMSIPITVSGVPIFTTAAPGLVCVAGSVSLAGISDVSVQDNAPVSVRGGILGAVSLGGGTALIGGVSVRGTPDVNAIQSGTWTVQPGNTANTTPWLVSVTGNVSLSDNAPVSVRGGVLGAVSLGGGSAHIGRVSVFVDATPLTVSVSPAAAPIAVSVVGGRVSQAGIADVSIQDHAPVSVRGGVLGAVSLGGGAAHIGRVSVAGIVTVAGPVSLAGISDVSVQDNAPVSVRGGVLGAVSLGGGSAHIGRVSVFVDATPLTVSVSPAAAPIATSVVGGRVSIQGISQVSVAGAVTVSPLTNTGAAVPNGAFFVGGTDGTNLRGLRVDSSGNLIVRVSNEVSVWQTLTATASVNVVMVSIGGAVSNQAIQVAFTDGADARTPRVNTEGNILAHVCNSPPNVAQVSVQGSVGTQALYVAGRDENDIARGLLVDSMGVTRSTGFKQKSQYQFTRPADTTAYASGDLVANNTTAGSVTPLSFKVGRISSGPHSVQIRRGTIFKTTAGTANTAAIRLHIFDTATGVSVVNGDNGAFTASPVTAYCGYMDFAAAVLVTTAFRPTNAAAALCAMWQTQTFNAGTEMNIALASGQTSISGLLECRGAWTPGNAETMTVILEFIQD